MTGDAIVDRIRSVCVRSPFAFTEAQTWESFELQPTTNVDRVFRIPPPVSQAVVGGFSFTEDRTDSIQVWVARKHFANYAAVRQTLVRDMHSLTAAIIRDAHQDSGEYGVQDGGRGHAITPDQPNKDYVALRLTLPVRYEVQL